MEGVSTGVIAGVLFEVPIGVGIRLGRLPSTEDIGDTVDTLDLSMPSSSLISLSLSIGLVTGQESPM